MRQRILTNPEVIAINQDKWAQANVFIMLIKSRFMQKTENGDVAVAFLNRKSTAG